MRFFVFVCFCSSYEFKSFHIVFKIENIKNHSFKNVKYLLKGLAPFYKHSLTQTELTHVPHLAKCRVSAFPQNSCCYSNLSIQGKTEGNTILTS